jgi:hypothetical protein
MQFEVLSVKVPSHKNHIFLKLTGDDEAENTHTKTLRASPACKAPAPAYWGRKAQASELGRLDFWMSFT